MGTKVPDLVAGRIIANCTTEAVKDDVMNQGAYGYTYICTYLTHPRCCADVKQLVAQAKQLNGGADNGLLMPNEVIEAVLPPIGVPDIVLPPRYWSDFVVGRISPWIDPDSDDPYIRRLSEKALVDELRYFSYLSLGYVLVRLRGVNHGNLARILTRHIEDKSNYSFMVWTEVPIASSSAACSNDGGTPIPNGDWSTMNGEVSEHNSDSENSGTTYAPLPQTNEPWRWFYNFRVACNNDSRIGVFLELTPDLPDSSLAIDRWKGEPLRALKFNTRTFITDPKSGLPVLPVAHETLAKKLFALNLNAIIEGPELHIRHGDVDEARSVSPKLENGEGSEVVPLCVYYEYLNSLWKLRPTPDALSQWAPGYEDYLQTPLQPLGDHLESQVYETFEKDPVKYSEYERAIDAVVAAKCENRTNLVLMVLGAGRGPLVAASYTVLKKRNVASFKLYAVEKNPNAIVTLLKKRATEWNNEVEVIFSDMRSFNPPEKADIIVSELLGSFGDNELSPECLDGAQHLMKEDCISIPRTYSSFIGPLHSPRLFGAVRSVMEREGFQKTAVSEAAYVVRIYNYFEIAAPKHLFKFDHPNFSLLSNDRHKELEFFAQETSEIMGFVGYFTAVLSDGILLSILPRCQTNGLFSWFPILFPIQKPVLVKKGQRIRVRFWRCSNERKVWYEWQLVEPMVFPIANTGGKTYSMRLL